MYILHICNPPPHSLSRFMLLHPLSSQYHYSIGFLSYLPGKISTLDLITCYSSLPVLLWVVEKLTQICRLISWLLHGSHILLAIPCYPIIILWFLSPLSSSLDQLFHAFFTPLLSPQMFEFHKLNIWHCFLLQRENRSQRWKPPSLPCHQLSLNLLP